MKSIILIACSLLFSGTIYSQKDLKYTYLIVKIESDFDRTNLKSFYKINAERGNPFANEVYGLIQYYTGKKAVNTGASYFPAASDTAQLFYNYFNNVTQAILYLSQNKWELVSVFNQVSSDKSTDGGYPYTTFSSYPVYYFKKEIQ
jgi:hypothetical protein